MARVRISLVKEPDRIISYWKKEKLVVACIVMTGLLYNGMMVLGPVFQGRLIDAVAGEASLSTVLNLACGYVAIIGVIQTARYFKRFYIRRFANCTSASMRLMIYNHIVRQSAASLESEQTGNLMTRAVSDVDLCVEGMRKSTTEIFDTGVLMISYLICMFLYDVRLTLAGCVFVPIAMYLAERLKLLVYQYSAAYRQASSELAELTLDRAENAMVYRSGGVEEINQAEYDQKLGELSEKAVKASVLENAMMPVYKIISYLGVVPVIYVGGAYALDGAWTVGMFSAYLVMFTSMTTKASRAARLLNSVQKSQISWRRIKPYLSAYQKAEETKEPGVREETVKSEKDRMAWVDRGLADGGGRAVPGPAAVAVSHLAFTYPGGRQPVIEDIHFEVKLGEIIGVTGPVGCGKSALGLALLGLYPYRGSIKIQGKELRTLSDGERSALIAYQGHAPSLLSGTIRDNILLGLQGDVSQVLSDVCFDSDLAEMPQGENTPVGPGGMKLSGGQQARVALARTLYEKKSVILLDDPFASVDRRTEDEIITHLRERYRDCAILLISHRISAFRSADRILLIHRDRTCEQGTHGELLARSPLYASIYRLQAEEGGGLS